jgi:molybdenum cofactor cytidylyltransferase
MIEVLVQVAAASREKRVYNERTLEYLETRCTARPYPYPYGFVIATSAADGDCVDCYVLTHDILQAGTIVACEPVGLLEQDEGGEVDHKVLAALSGQAVVLGHELLQELQDFIAALFAAYPDSHVRVGPLLPREAALRHLQSHQVMQTNKSVADLFEEEPTHWGLRGDPYLWRDMKATLRTAMYPGTEEQLTALLEQTYQQLTGVALTNPDPVFVERYSHGGMSSGSVSPQFWAETAIPLLRARYGDRA